MRKFVINRRSIIKGLAASSVAGVASMASKSTIALNNKQTCRGFSSAEWEARLSTLAKYSSSRIPGFSVTYLSKNIPEWSQARGLISAEQKNKVTPDTIFQAASLTKPIVATIVMRLRERGVIELDKPLLEYFDYPDVMSSPEAKKVTARLVLSHRTGLPNWRKVEDGLTVKFMSAPGEKHGYSGEGYIWLQASLEEITGKSLHQLANEEVFEPLSMKNSSLGFIPDRIKSKNFARAHDGNANLLGDGKVKKIADAFINEGFDIAKMHFVEARSRISSSKSLSEILKTHPTHVPVTASGSLVCTSSDYAHFMRVFTNGSSSKFMQDESIQEMLKPHIKIKPYTSAGLGGQLEHTPTGMAFSHGGFNRGFKSFSIGRPDTDQVAVLLTNSNEGQRLRWPIIGRLTDAGHADFLG